MALKLFLKQQFNSAVGVSGNTPTYQYASLARSVLAFTTAVTNTTASGSNIQMTQTGGGSIVSWVSPPAAYIFTISGLTTMNLWAFESNALANATVQVRFCKMSITGTVGSAFMTSSFGTELGTTASVCNWTATPTTTTLAVGERLVVYIDATNATSLTMGASQTVTLDYAGLTVGADGDSWISFTQADTFTTTFPATESPISQSGIWLNGATTATNWNDCQTTTAFAGGVGPAAVDFSDPTAVLHPGKTGPWRPSQYAKATIFASGSDATKFKECELRLNSILSPRINSGYEIDFGNHLSPYFTPGIQPEAVSIIRWNGVLAHPIAGGNNDNHGFDDITKNSAMGNGVVNGDVIEAMNYNGVISGFVNGVLVSQAVDTTFTAGSPGIGFAAGCDPLYATFGISDFTADNIPFLSEPEFIQYAQGANFTAVNATTITMPGVTAAGNLIVAYGFILTDTLVSIADDLGDVITALPGNPVTWDVGLINYNWFIQNMKGGTATALTMTKSAADAGGLGIRMAEYGGMAAAPLDIATVANNGNGTAQTSNIPAPTNFPFELIVAQEDDTGATSTLGTSFVLRSPVSQPDTITFDKVVSSIGVYQATATVSPTCTWVMNVATYKAAQQPIVPSHGPFLQRPGRYLILQRRG